MHILNEEFLKKTMSYNVTHQYPLSYNGSLIWPILFAIFASPACLLLLIKNTRYLKEDSSFRLAYKGSWFWAIFWSMIFFPIALALLFLNGADVEEHPIMPKCVEYV
jgi:hypothetical protein